MAKIDTLNEVKTILSQEADFLKPLLKSLLTEILQAEMKEVVGADIYQRSGERRGYRAGYYSRQYITRVGSIDLLRIPRYREGKFSTELFLALPAFGKSFTDIFIRNVHSVMVPGGNGSVFITCTGSSNISLNASASSAEIGTRGQHQ